MLSSKVIAKNILKIVEGKDKEYLDKVAKKIVKNFPEKSALIVKALKEIQESSESEVLIITAKELSFSGQESLKKIISEKFSYPLNFKFKIKKEIGSGIIIKKGEHVIDSSLENFICQLKEKIQKTNISINRSKDVK